MPVGLVIMHWDERVGANIKAQYPLDISIQPATLMQVYSQHEYHGESGMVSFITGPLNIASYYTGPETHHYVILLMNMDEDVDAYEEGLAELARQVLMNLEGDAYKQIMSSLFQRISVYPKLSEEQKLAMMYHTEIKRMILQRLRDEAMITKAELSIWLKDKYKQGFFDMDSVLIGLIKQELVKSSSVTGITSEVVFMIRDLMMSRVPPANLMKDIEHHGLPSSLKEKYREEIIKFFKDYTPSDSDNLKIIAEVILEPQVYETLKLLRMAAVTRDDLEKLKKKGVEDVDFVLKTLWENNIISVFQDREGNEYYCMKSNFRISTFFPEYLLDVLRNAYTSKNQHKSALIRELELLRELYFQSKKSFKDVSVEKGSKKKEADAAA